MSEACTHDCSTCGSSCSTIDEKDLIAPLNKSSSIKHVYAVMSGKGGDVLLETATRVLHEEYPELTGKLEINLPDEKFRRLGQSVVAASL